MRIDPLRQSKKKSGCVRSGRLKVGFVFNHSYFLGGGEVSFSELIRALDSNLFEPIIFVPRSGEIKRHYRRQNIRVVVTPFPPLKRFFRNNFLIEVKYFANKVEQLGIDILHANGSRVCFYSGIAGMLKTVPVVWHVRETLKDFFLYDFLLACLCARYLCVSKSVREKRFSRFGPWILRKSAVVYNGIDTKKFFPDHKRGADYRNHHGIEDDEVFFGLVGNVIPRKGHDFFLRGMAAALEQTPSLRIKAIFVGHLLDLSYKENLERFVAKRHLEGLVRFEEYLENIREIYNAMDVFVLTSRSEGFSRALLEAMSSGLPVLATDISEIKEALFGIQKTLLVKPYDTQGLARRITSLAKDKDLRKTLGRKNRENTAVRFGLSRHARNVERIYSQIISGQK